MGKPSRYSIVSTIALAAAAGPAMAHPGADIMHGFGAGFGHPWMGADHLLAMIAVGLWATAFGGRALWALPVSFVASMAAGAILLWAGFILPGQEAGVAASVVVLGLVLGMNRRPSIALACTLLAGMGLFHGHVHAGELAAGSNAFGYAAGFLAGTAALHGLGIGAGFVSRHGAELRRGFGWLCAWAGLLLWSAV